MHQMLRVWRWEPQTLEEEAARASCLLLVLVLAAMLLWAVAQVPEFFHWLRTERGRERKRSD